MISFIRELIKNDNDDISDLPGDESYAEKDVPELHTDDSNLKEKEINDSMEGGIIPAIKLSSTSINVIMILGNYVDPSLFEMLRENKMYYLDMNKLAKTEHNNFLLTLPNKFITQENKEEQYANYLSNYIKDKEANKKALIIKLSNVKYNIFTFMNDISTMNPNWIYLNLTFDSLTKLLNTQRDEHNSISNPNSWLFGPVSKYFKLITSENNTSITLKKSSIIKYLNENKYLFESEKELENSVNEFFDSFKKSSTEIIVSPKFPIQNVNSYVIN